MNFIKLNSVNSQKNAEQVLEMLKDKEVGL